MYSKQKRKAKKKDEIKKYLLNPAGMLAAGLVLGIVIRFLDIYTTNFGNIFSQIAVWILFGTIISTYSATPKAAMFNIFPFCMGMLITYYAVAIITNGVYNKIYFFGWMILALCSPLLGYVVWFAKCTGFIAKFISIGIVVASLLSSVVLFEHLRIYDFVISGLLIYFLFYKKFDK